jgi:hypothetical protein
MDSPQFHRQRNPNLDTTELRVTSCPKVIVDALQIVSHSRGESGTSPLVIEILQEWVDRRTHEWRVAHRVARGNPELMALIGKDSE